MLQAIVLAGGFSSRAGMNKMTLPVAGVPIVRRAVAAVEPYVDAVVVVTGRFHDDIVDVLSDLPKVTFVRNPLFENGMFDSVRCGVGATRGDMLILPGDMPLVSGTTVARILAAPGDVRVPTYRKQPGHPIFVAAVLRSALLSYDGDGGLRGFRDRQGYAAVPTDDPGILADVDTLDDYRRLTQREGKGNAHED